MTQDNKSWEDEFNELVADNIGREYPWEETTLDETIKSFIHSTLNKEKVLLVEEIIKDLDNIWRKQLPIADAEDAVEKTRSAMIEQANYLQSLLS